MLQAGVHLFVEKPLSIQPIEDVTKLGNELARLQKAHNLVIAVGYMLRYSATIQVITMLP